MMGIVIYPKYVFVLIPDLGISLYKPCPGWLIQSWFFFGNGHTYIKSDETPCDEVQAKGNGIIILSVIVLQMHFQQNDICFLTLANTIFSLTPFLSHVCCALHISWRLVLYNICHSAIVHHIYSHITLVWNPIFYLMIQPTLALAITT